MTERTSLFHSLCGAASAQPPSRRPQPHSQFLVTTTGLSHDLSLLEREIKLFQRDQARGTLTGTSLSKSGQAISSGAERVQKKLTDVEQRLKALRQQYNPSISRSFSSSSQAILHADKVIQTLEQQLSALAKGFQLDLQQSAKKLAGRQERQNSVFGKSVSYAPKQHQYHYPHHQHAPPPPQQLQPPVQQQQHNAVRFRGNATSSSASTPAAAFYSAQPLFVDDAPTVMHLQQQQQVRKNAYESTRSLGRTQEVERVESMIGEVSQMFMRVAGLVQEQGEVVQDIESLVDDSAANTQQAQTELLKLFRFVSSDRGLIIKLLLAALLFGMMVIYLWT